MKNEDNDENLEFDDPMEELRFARQQILDECEGDFTKIREYFKKVHDERVKAGHVYVKPSKSIKPKK